MSSLTNARNTWISSKHEFLEIRRTVIDRLLEVELVRGDLPTEATPKVMGLSQFEGMDYFIRILEGLDKETFVRGYVYGYGDRITKKNRSATCSKHVIRVMARMPRCSRKS